MNIMDILPFSYFETHRDFDDYIDILGEHLKSEIHKFKPLDTRGHTTNLAYKWHGCVNNNLEPYELQRLVSDLHSGIFLLLSIHEKDLNLQYSKFVEYLNNGFCLEDKKFNTLINTFRSTTSTLSVQSHQTGETIRLFFNEPFTPIPTGLSSTGKACELEPYIKPGVQHMIFDCPSGELIAADWIRIDKFTDASKRLLPYTKETSVNFESGKIMNACRTNEKMNLLDISLGNMSVNVYQNGNQLIVGDSYYYDRETDEDEYVEHEGFKETAKICTDRWTFSCIDRVNLEKILAEEGVSDPKLVVDEYLAERNYGVNTLKINPGKYHVYFSGDYDEFNEQFKSPDFPLKDKFRYFAIISDKELSLDNVVNNETGLSI